MAEEDVIEIWEATTDSIVFLNVKDPVKKGWKQVKVTLQGPKRVQITLEERRFNQSQIPEENLALDPFSNGQLICVQGDAKGTNMLTDDDLVTILTLDDDEGFEAAVTDLDSEVLVRRLLGLSETRATHNRFEFIRDLVDVRYRVGGTQRTVQQMIDDGEKVSATLPR
jgi:hypothetical protein